MEGRDSSWQLTLVVKARSSSSQMRMQFHLMNEQGMSTRLAEAISSMSRQGARNHSEPDEKKAATPWCRQLRVGIEDSREEARKPQRGGIA